MIKVGDILVARKNLRMVDTGQQFLTEAKEYEVIKLWHDYFFIIDDQGDKNRFYIEEVDLHFLKKQKTDSIVDEVIKQFRKRSQVGIEKYGTTLAENNTDDFLEHTKQELMDAVNYIQKLQSQREETIENKVIEWAKNRNLIKMDNAPKQIIKLQEEIGELASAYLKNNYVEIRDAIGDIQVVLIILSEQLNIDYKKCLEDAYNVIKDRKGITTNGTFLKDENN